MLNTMNTKCGSNIQFPPLFLDDIQIKLSRLSSESGSKQCLENKRSWFQLDLRLFVEDEVDFKNSFCTTQPVLARKGCHNRRKKCERVGREKHNVTVRLEVSKEYITRMFFLMLRKNVAVLLSLEQDKIICRIMKLLEY